MYFFEHDKDFEAPRVERWNGRFNILSVIWGNDTISYLERHKKIRIYQYVAELGNGKIDAT